MRLEDFVNKNKNKIAKIHWNETVQKYVDNLSLLKKFKKEEYFSLSKTFFEDITNGINNYIKNAINPSYQIAIVGAIKAGKSTLIGEELASVSVTPETATLTKFRYSEKNCIKLKFYTKEHWEKIWKNANNKKATKFLKEYQELESDTVKDYLLDREEEYKEFFNIDELKKEVERWTSSQSK